MRNEFVLDLADCTEFRLALEARPPRVVHGTMILLVALLATALAWSVATQANLVVRSTGRVRPVATPVKVFSGGRGEILSATAGGRVALVNARIGDVVTQGDVLVRLETTRLENEIAKQDRAIRAGKEELSKLVQLEELLTHQYEATRAKAEAELKRARDEAHRADEQRGSEIRLAELALSTAEAEETASRRLVERLAAARTELRSAEAKTHEAKEKLARARIPIDDGGAQVAQRALELAERDYAVKREELDQKRRAKRGEVETARLELANLELERKQAVIRAPVSGIVTAGDVKVGDVLEPGKPVAEIARQAGFHFEASVSSGEVGRLRLGMPVRVKLDAYDYQKYGTLGGTVCFISPDSEVSEGQKATTYTVRILMPRDEVGRGAVRGRVKLGMAGQAEIVTGRENLLMLLIKQIRQTISLG
jgi:multidrug resistance efflux pump